MPDPLGVLDLVFGSAVGRLAPWLATGSPCRRGETGSSASVGVVVGHVVDDLVVETIVVVGVVAAPLALGHFALRRGIGSHAGAACAALVTPAGPTVPRRAAAGGSTDGPMPRTTPPMPPPRAGHRRLAARPTGTVRPEAQG